MLQHIYNVRVGILHNYLELVVNDYTYLLNESCLSNNRDAYMYIFKHITKNKLIFNPDWCKSTLYLLEAIELYPPRKKLAKKILSNLITNVWSKEAEQVVKKLIPLVDIDIDDIGFSQYSHLVPTVETLGNHTAIMGALEFNNVEEVKHRIQYYDPNNIALYAALLSPIDNKECFAAILPLLTGTQSLSIYIISAYVNNKLPDYAIPKYQYNVCIQAIICHFTGSTDLGYAEWDSSVITIADKFNFGIPLLYECVRRSIQYKSILYGLSPSMQHKVDVITRRIMWEKPIDCHCEFCNELTKDRY